MNEEGTAKRQLSNNVLIAILAVLILLIIGLIIGIVVVNISNGQNQDITPTVAVVTDEAAKAQADEDEAFVRDLNNQLTEMTEIDEAQAFLDEKLAEHQDDSKAFRIKVMKMWVYINAGEPDQALPIAETINEDELDDYQKLKLYSTLNRLYQDLGDEETSQNYVTKWGDMHEKIYGGLQF